MKSEKKVKKDKKKKKKKSTTSDSEEDQKWTATSEAPVEISEQENSILETKQNAKNFFSQLRQHEATKDQIGTIHAQGVKPVVATAVTEEWECIKRGCGKKNSKHAAACSKCGAMKRLSEWR
jgi:hypothetical protein